eukprot:scaffold762_cov363-Pavlova_lutheri.AAC.8
MECTAWKGTCLSTSCKTNRTKVVRRSDHRFKETRRSYPWRCASGKGEVADSSGPVKYGFGFGIGGLLFPYYLGVVRELREEGYLVADTPTAGSSAGAIAAGIHVSQLSVDEVLLLTIGVMDDFREKRRIGTLREIVRARMHHHLPKNIHELASGRIATVLCTFPGFEAVKILHYDSPEDFINALLASSHVPIYMNWSPFVGYHDYLCIDALFSDCIPLPEGNGLKLVRVSCFPQSLLRRFGRSAEIYYGKCEDQRHTLLRLLGWIFCPPETKEIHELIAQGRDDVKAWIAEQESTPVSS